MDNKTSSVPKDFNKDENKSDNTRLSIISRSIGIMESHGKYREAVGLCELIHNDQRAITNMVRAGLFMDAERKAAQKGLERTLARAYEKTGHSSNAISSYIRCGLTQEAIRLCEQTQQFDIASCICMDTERHDDAQTYAQIHQAIKTSVNRRTV